MPLAWLWVSKIFLIEILNIENNLGVFSIPWLKPQALKNLSFYIYINEYLPDFERK